MHTVYALFIAGLSAIVASFDGDTGAFLAELYNNGGYPFGTFPDIAQGPNGNLYVIGVNNAGDVATVDVIQTDGTPVISIPLTVVTVAPHRLFVETDNKLFVGYYGAFDSGGGVWKTNLQLYDILGNLTQSWQIQTPGGVFTSGIWGMVVRDDILYWAEGPFVITTPGTIHRYDLVGDVPLSDWLVVPGFTNVGRLNLLPGGATLGTSPDFSSPYNEIAFPAGAPVTEYPDAAQPPLDTAHFLARGFHLWYVVGGGYGPYPTGSIIRTDLCPAHVPQVVFLPGDNYPDSIFNDTFVVDGPDVDPYSCTTPPAGCIVDVPITS